MLMMFTCMTGWAQEEKEFDCFCVINQITAPYHKGYVLISLPDNDKLDVYLRDENNKGIRFANVSDALTYMSKRGWRYVDSYIADNYLRFVLSKKVKSIEEAYQGINVERTKKD